MKEKTIAVVTSTDRVGSGTPKKNYIREIKMVERREKKKNTRGPMGFKPVTS